MNHSFIFIVISDISIFSLGKKHEEEGKNSRKTTKRNLHIYIYFGALQKVWWNKTDKNISFDKTKILKMILMGAVSNMNILYYIYYTHTPISWNVFEARRWRYKHNRGVQEFPPLIENWFIDYLRRNRSQGKRSSSPREAWRNKYNHKTRIVKSRVGEGGIGSRIVYTYIYIYIHTCVLGGNETENKKKEGRRDPPIGTYDEKIQRGMARTA